MPDNMYRVGIGAEDKEFQAVMKRMESNVTRLTTQIESRMKKAESGMNGMEHATRKADAAVNHMSHSAMGLEKQLGMIGQMLTTGAIIYGVHRLASGAIDLGASFAEAAGGFETMKISLDTLSRGRGEEYFTRLNQWALRMPINTEAALQSYIMMDAMGLRPLIKDMTTLVDTTSALGGRADTMTSIARALGQMTTKQRVAGQEINQLAEAGINATAILQEKLGMTTDDFEKMGRNAELTNRAVQALFQGMEERFGGQSERIMSTYKGLKEQLIGDWREYQRVVMDGGPFDVVKGYIREVDQMIKRMNSGEYEKRYREKAGDYFKKFGVEPKGGFYKAGQKMEFGRFYTPEQYREYENYRRQQEAISGYIKDYTAPVKPAGAGTGDEGEKWKSVRTLGEIREQEALIALEKRYQSYDDDRLKRRESEEKIMQERGAGWLKLSEERIEKENELIRQSGEQRIINRTEGFERERALAEFNYLAERERIVEAYGERSSAVLALEELHAAEMIGIDRDMHAEMRQNALNMAGWWGDTVYGLWQAADGNFANIGRSFDRMIRGMLVKMAIFETVNMIFGGAPGLGIKMATGFPGRASGGPVTGGQPYLVGERGPEVFVPNTSGKIVSNNAVNNISMSFAFSAADRSEMAGMSDAQLAQKLIRVVRDHPKVAKAIAGKS